MIKYFYFVLAACILVLTSCVTVMTDMLSSMVLGYTNDQIAANMKTLDPEASYSKRSAIFLTVLGDEQKMAELERKFPNMVDSVLNVSRKNTEQIVISTEEADIIAYLVYPENRSKSKKYPVVLYSHGGGFSLWHFKEFQSLTGQIADKTDTCVLFYEYRLAPEFKFPCAVNDTFNVYKWLLDDKNAVEHSLDNSKVVFMGDSSGGNLLAGLAIRAAENKLPNAKGVCLLYPSLDVSDNINFSRIAFSGIEDPNRYYVTNMEYLASVSQKYLEKPEDAYRPYASPLIMLEGLVDVKGYNNKYAPYKTSLTVPLHLPPHFIGVASVDALRDEGKTYYALLKSFGVDARVKVYDGMFHGFVMMDKFIFKADECLQDCYSFICEVLDIKRPED